MSGPPPPPVPRGAPVPAPPGAPPAPAVPLPAAAPAPPLARRRSPPDLESDSSDDDLEEDIDLEETRDQLAGHPSGFLDVELAVDDLAVDQLSIQLERLESQTLDGVASQGKLIQLDELPPPAACRPYATCDSILDFCASRVVGSVRMGCRNFLGLFFPRSGPKKRMFDDLFADQETAFKYLAELVATWIPTRGRARYVVRLEPPKPPASSTSCLGCLSGGKKKAEAELNPKERKRQKEVKIQQETWDKWYGELQWHQQRLGVSGSLGWGVNFYFGLLLMVPLVTGVSVGLFLPAFFLLLLVRTTTVETEDTKFVERQDKIQTETKAKHTLRICRFLGRTLPMLGFCTAWPILLTIYIVPRVSRGLGTTLLLLHLAAVLVLQAAGTIRAGQVCTPHAPPFHAWTC